MNRLRIATRKSKLALWQAQYAADCLARARPSLEIEMVPLSTRGDQRTDVPLAEIGGKGLFIKELERALLEDRADIAVHSMKDLPAQLPEDLCIASVLPRHDPRDAFLSDNYSQPEEMPRGAVLGTSSLRRQCLMRHARPDLETRFLRGNVQTRLRRLDDGDYDAIVLAASGLDRMDLAKRIRTRLSPEVSLPSVGQGTIGIECREDLPDLRALLGEVEDAETAVRTAAERAFNARLQGSCSTPIAAYAELHGERIHLRGLVGLPDGSRLVQGEREGLQADAVELGDDLGREILARGGREILAQIQQTAP